jgi:hypothetical protein
VKLNNLFTFHDLISIIYGVVGLLFTGFVASLLFQNPPGPEAYILGKGWCTCLIVMGVLAWGARGLRDVKARKLMAPAFFVYFITGAVIWLLDQIARGWILFGWVTFFLLLLFTIGYGYFLFMHQEIE